LRTTAQVDIFPISVFRSDCRYSVVRTCHPAYFLHRVINPPRLRLTDDRKKQVVVVFSLLIQSTPEPIMYLDHKSNRTGDISPSRVQPNTRFHIHNIEAPRTPRSRGVGPFECCFQVSQNPARSWAREDHEGPAECGPVASGLLT